tara:strand:+ start:223 stop:627 length:405 start_codon:yes stop_codon:yes gene_type:complete
MIKIELNNVDISFHLNNRQYTQTIFVTLKNNDYTAIQQLKMIVCSLYAREQFGIDNNSNIFCPFFGNSSFYLSYKSKPKHPIYLFNALSRCICFYDESTFHNIKKIPEKQMILKKKFGYDIARMISEYCWGICL